MIVKVCRKKFFLEIEGHDLVFLCWVIFQFSSDDLSAFDDLKWRANLQKFEIGRFPRYCEVGPSTPVTSARPLLVRKLQDFPKLSDFRPRQRSTDLSTSFTCPIHQKIPPSCWPLSATVRLSRHIEKVIWGQNQTNLHETLLTELWSFPTDLFEIWSDGRQAYMQIAIQVLIENYAMLEMKEESFAQPLH